MDLGGATSPYADTWRRLVVAANLLCAARALLGARRAEASCDGISERKLQLARRSPGRLNGSFDASSVRGLPGRRRVCV